MNQQNYVRLSLELHLFFDRIMKEHSLFLEAAFINNDKELRKIASDFQKIFSDTLRSVINIANGNVSEDFIRANEIVTKNTLDAETKTQKLSSISIDTTLTTDELRIKSGNINISEQLIDQISNINKRTLPVIQNLIYFKNDILNNVLSCKLYTTNYPLLITHIMNEAKMYYDLLNKVERKEPFTKNYIYEQELFWNNIMMEHAEFIRGLLDPSEKELILTADKYTYEYEKIIKNYSNNPLELNSISLNQTINFRDFKIVGEEGILNCKIKSIIIPLLADHVVREANHFIRILKGNN